MDIAVTNRTLTILLIIAYLVLDLVLTGGIITVTYTQLSNQQYELPALITTHPENAQYYIQAFRLDQMFLAIIDVIVFVFLIFVGQKPVKLLHAMINQKDKEDNTEKYRANYKKQK